MNMMIILQIKTKRKKILQQPQSQEQGRRESEKSQRRKDRLLNRNKVSEFSSLPFL